MACISKLASAIAYDCDTGATGLVSAIIINKADIESYSLTGTPPSINALSLVSGAKAYKIDTVKRSLVVTSALKVNEGAPNALTHTANLVITSAPEASEGRAITTALTNGTFVILTKGVYGGSMAYGLYYGMNATAIDRSTHDNGGWISATLSTPENVIGEDAIYSVSSVYDALYAAAV